MPLASVVLAAALTLPRHAVFGAALADKPAGTTVTRVIPGTAAARAGIADGDVLRSLAGVPTPNVAAFLGEMHRLHAGESVTIVTQRGGAAQTIAVALGAPPDENDPAVTTSYEAISVDSTLRRTLVTTPKNARGPLPAVLVLGGIGCYSVDVAANPEDAYMRLTHDLSRAGFVTMRVEKSGVGDSQGAPCAAADYVSEERMYAAALDSLRTHSGVDPNRVFLFGHSIGTISAARLALRQHVAGIVIAEAVGRDWPEYEVRNLRRQLEVAGASPADVDKALLNKEQCMTRLLLEKQPEDAIEREMPECKEPNGVYPVGAAYMQQVAGIDIIGTWSKVTVPVLVVYGRSDVVTEEADHRRIVDVINGRHPHSATFRAIEGMDHLLFVARTPKEAMELFDKAAPRRYDAAFSDVVAQWLRVAARS